MTVEMAAYLIYIARMCNYIFMHIQTKGRYVPSSFIWFGMNFYVFMYLARLFSLNYICEKISIKVNIHVNFHIYVSVYTHACVRILCTHSTQTHTHARARVWNTCGNAWEKIYRVDKKISITKIYKIKTNKFSMKPSFLNVQTFTQRSREGHL